MTSAGVAQGPPAKASDGLYVSLEQLILLWAVHRIIKIGQHKQWTLLFNKISQSQVLTTCFASQVDMRSLFNAAVFNWS